MQPHEQTGWPKKEQPKFPPFPPRESLPAPEPEQESRSGRRETPMPLSAKEVERLKNELAEKDAEEIQRIREEEIGGNPEHVRPPRDEEIRRAKENTEEQRQLKYGLMKLTKICDALDVFEDEDAKLFQEFKLDSVADRCRLLAERIGQDIKKDSTAYARRGVELQDTIGNFEGALGAFTFLQRNPDNQAIQNSLRKNVDRFGNYIDGMLGTAGRIDRN